MKHTPTDDMLAALKRVNAGVADDDPEMWRQVKQAIAKAEGRNP